MFMSLGNAKRTANREKRRELREQLTPEKEVLKDRKLIKEEVNRRLVSGLQTMTLEYDSLSKLYMNVKWRVRNAHNVTN